MNLIEGEDFNQDTILVNHNNGKNIIMLTEFGLYKILMRSRKEIAISFQRWVCGTNEEALFKASDIGKILGIKELGNNIKKMKLNENNDYLNLTINMNTTDNIRGPLIHVENNFKKHHIFNF